MKTKKDEKMYNEIIFSPDPRFPQHELIGVDNQMEYQVISIQLGYNGKFEMDGSHSAILQRRDDEVYELCTFNLEKKHFEKTLVFSDTYNLKTICDRVEELFNQGRFKPFCEEDDSKPVLVLVRNS